MVFMPLKNVTNIFPIKIKIFFIISSSSVGISVLKNLPALLRILIILGC